MIAVFYLWGCINLSTWIDLENIFDNRQGFGTELKIEECLHNETDVIISNDLYQQLLSELNKYYDDTDKIVLDLNNNVNFVKSELEKTNNNVSLNRTSIENIMSELITVKNNISNNTTNIEKNKNDIIELDELITQLNVTINNIDKKYNYLKENIIIVTNDSELRNALTNNIRYIFVKSNEVFKPTEAYLIPENTKIIGINKPVFDCSFSSSLNNMFRNKLNGTEREYNGSGNITIEGLTFIGNNMSKAFTCLAFAHADNIKIKNCKFEGFNNWHNIELSGCRNVIIEENYFVNFGQGSSNPTEVIQLDLPSSNSVYPWECYYDSTPCNDVIIRNNDFDTIATSTGVIGQHTYVEGKRHENIRIENNRLYNVDNFVYLLGTNNLKVLNNYGENVFNFMYFGTASNNQQTNTEITGNEIYFKQNYTIKPPEPSGYTGKFIYPILSSSATVINDNNLIINNNIISNCKDHAITTSCNRVVICNNILNNVTKHSIYIWGGNRAVITGNIVYGSNAVGIMLGGNNNIKSERCICTNNIASIGTGANYISSNSLESGNVTN